MIINTQSRERFLQALKLQGMTDFKIFGYGVQDASVEYESDEETKRYVVDKAGRTVNKGYTLSQGVESEVIPNDPLWEPLNKLRRELGLGASAAGTLLNVNLFDSEDEQPASVTAEQFDVNITINTFGGASEDLLSIGYTINYQGAPELGTVALTYELDGDIKFAFTKDTVTP